MYARMPGGTRNPGGYVVPCDVIWQKEHGAFVELTDITGKHKWKQYIKKEHLLTDEEAERE